MHQMNRATSNGNNSIWTYTTDTTSTIASTCNLHNTHCVSEEEEEKNNLWKYTQQHSTWSVY